MYLIHESAPGPNKHTHIPIKSPPTREVRPYACSVLNGKKKKPKMSDGANNAPYGPARRMRLRRKHQLVVLSILWKMRNYYLRLCRQKDAEQRRLQEVGRRYWVHPINVRRETRGHIGCLYDDLRRHPDKFQDFVRLPMEAFDNLLSILTPHLQRQDTYMRKSIPPVGRLLITLSKTQKSVLKDEKSRSLLDHLFLVYSHLLDFLSKIHHINLPV
ncbi:uncharacterized protein [Dendropsophus ebraccatus]|uniref:uncharacterized protein n=1 Tax=Dendropsophus ebraccatus TaxID=150705 RepID=UPI0038317CCE